MLTSGRAGKGTLRRHRMSAGWPSDPRRRSQTRDVCTNERGAPSLAARRNDRRADFAPVVRRPCGVRRAVETVAVGVFVYQHTHSAFIVAMMTMLRLLPMGCLLFGAIADRMERRTTLILSSSAW